MNATTDRTEFPVCPHCGAKDQYWRDGCDEGEPEDGDSWEVTCATCDTDYTVTAHVDVRFSTKTEAPHA